MQIDSGTFKFLSALKKNNNKNWFDAHRPQYEILRKNFYDFTDAVIAGLAKINPDISGLTAKTTVYRINRDIRFSKDKSPYKHNFAAGFAKGGKKSPYPGYYLHIQPGTETYIGGGLWRPEKEVLAKVRQEIDYNLKDYKKIITKKSFIATFDDVYDDKISTVPKGYDASNPALEYLKYKSFIYGRSFTDKEVLSKDFLKMVINTYKELNPFILFLNRAME